MSSASAQLTSFVAESRATAVVSLSADCSNVPYPVGASARGSGLIFRVTTPTVAHLEAAFRLSTSQVSNWNAPTIHLSSGTYNPTLGFQNAASIVSRYWVPGSVFNTWSPDGSLDQTLTLAPGDYQFNWNASLGQGGARTQLGHTGAGSMQITESLTLSAAGPGADCVAITSNLAPQIPLGSAVQVDGTCCDGAPAPALGSPFLGIVTLTPAIDEPQTSAISGTEGQVKRSRAEERVQRLGYTKSCKRTTSYAPPNT